jgi:type II secretory pathway pseudopilin PulG
VEILAVVVILGIASAIIIPQIGSRDDLRASAAARAVMADLIYAQNRSIAMQKRHYVRFVGQQYTVSDTTALTAITHPVSKNPYTVTFDAAGTGYDNVTLGGWGFGGPSTICFDEMGSPYSYDGINPPTALTSSGTISVTAGNVTLTMTIEPFTGEVTVQ